MMDLTWRPARAWWPELRRLWRLLRVVVHLFQGVCLALVCGAFWWPWHARVRRAVHGWLRRLLQILGVELEVQGRPATGTVFLVANHVSWLDIPVIGVQRPVHFLSKAEVRHWPLIGWLARAAGTLYIRRGRGESMRKAEEIAVHLSAGRSVLVFPEGTTTDGLQLRRFHGALFRAPVMAAVPVQSVAVRYLDDQGRPDREPAFIGEATFHHHLWQLLRRDRIRVRVSWGRPLSPREDHDQLASLCRQQVLSLLAP